MPRVDFNKENCLSARSNVGRQAFEGFPKIYGSRMPHSNLQEPSAPALLVIQNMANRPVQTVCSKFGLDTCVNGLWRALIQPGVQLS
jgi:hypothetical protein